MAFSAGDIDFDMCKSFDQLLASIGRSRTAAGERELCIQLIRKPNSSESHTRPPSTTKLLNALLLARYGICLRYMSDSWRTDIEMRCIVRVVRDSAERYLRPWLDVVRGISISCLCGSIRAVRGAGRPQTKDGAKKSHLYCHNNNA